MSNYAPLALEGGRGMGKRLVRLVVVVVVMGGLSAYPAVMSSARADDTIALQLELTRVCQGTSGPPYGGNPVCIDSGAALDGSFVGTTPTQSAPPGVDCTGTWQLVAVDGSGDGLVGTMTFCGETTPPEVGVTQGFGRFAGYSATPTPQPSYVIQDVALPLSVPDNPLCGFHRPLGYCPTIPGDKVATGVVTLTLTKPAA